MDLNHTNRTWAANGADIDFPHPLDPYPPVIVNVALTGVIPTKTLTPFVPLSPDEVVSEAVACHDAGAAVVHVHARDLEGRATYDAGVFAEIIAGIRRERPQLIISATTRGRRYGEFDQRAAVLDLAGDLKPDLASLTTGSLNFPDGPSVNAPDVIVRLAERMRERGIKPELEILELGMINTAKLLIKRGLVDPPYYFNILLGSMYTAPATVLNLCAAVADLPRLSVWSSTGLGVFQLKINTAGLLMGGHVRVGVEDNVYYDHARTKLATNVEQVERMCRIAGELQRSIATAEEARTMMGLPAFVTETDTITVRVAADSDMNAMLKVLKTANMHYIPSEEMPELDWRCCFVASHNEHVIGMSGYKVLGEGQGKTTLMAVHPNYRGYGVGKSLQVARLRAMASLGVETVVTNADRPPTIEWYKKHYGYKKIGNLKKIHEFGDPDVTEWTTLRMDLREWMSREGGSASAACTLAGHDRE
jgi:3-keto-5-aminohexanoate cleavage enzyme